MVGSVCTGGLLLAEAGVLDHREATTHWGIVPLFHDYYPQIQLQPDKVLALSGPEHRIITAGGSASWVEMALYLIARFCGLEEAVRASKIFLLGDRSEGQLPFASMARPRSHNDAIIERCQTWIAEHYEVANPVARLAEYSGLSSRTFKRRFQQATGYSPIEYVQTLRIEEAKQLLEATDMQTDMIGIEVGYKDPASFRRLFKRMTKVTPARYRQRFRRVVSQPQRS
jgi:transcriptional regulator GlxA family with amidase domain